MQEIKLHRTREDILPSTMKNTQNAGVAKTSQVLIAGTVTFTPSMIQPIHLETMWFLKHPA